MRKRRYPETYLQNPSLLELRPHLLGKYVGHVSRSKTTLVDLEVINNKMILVWMNIDNETITRNTWFSTNSGRFKSYCRQFGVDPIHDVKKGK